MEEKERWDQYIRVQTDQRDLLKSIDSTLSRIMGHISQLNKHMEEINLKVRGE